MKKITIKYFTYLLVFITLMLSCTKEKNQCKSYEKTLTGEFVYIDNTENVMISLIFIKGGVSGEIDLNVRFPNQPYLDYVDKIEYDIMDCSTGIAQALDLTDNLGGELTFIIIDDDNFRIIEDGDLSTFTRN